jgi:hypothetical protein
MPLCFDEIFLFQESKAKVQGMMLKYPWLTLLWSTIASKDFQMLENCERSGKKNTGNMSLSQTGFSMTTLLAHTVAHSKGQLISKWFYEVVDFLQITNENNSHSSKSELIRSFFGGNR